MYLDHYGFSAKPFSKTPDPRFLYGGRGHAEALARMQYAVDEREIIVLTGEIGSGKTTLTRALIDHLGESATVVLIVNPQLTPTQLLRAIAAGLKTERPARSRHDLRSQINAALYECDRAGRPAVAIIDEAQLLPGREAFEELRLLTNFQYDHANLLSIVLVGQPELGRRLAHPGLVALSQRIGMRYHLGPLPAEDVERYIDHRLRVAGWDPGARGPLWDEDAIEALAELSRGIPRIINALAATSLLVGYGRDARRIDRPIVLEAAEELAIGRKGAENSPVPEIKDRD